MSWTPRHPDYKHQTEARRKALGKTGFAYFMEMGAGKSKTLIDELGSLAVVGTVDRILILAGKGSYADWVHEHIPTHWRDDILTPDVHLWQGARKPREMRKLELFFQPATIGTVKILVMNLEALSASGGADDIAAKFVKGGQTAMIIDEASKIKTRSAIRTKTVTRIGRHAVVRRILTGSPVTQSPMDLWSQFEFLGQRLLGFSNYMSFQSRFAETETVYLGKRKVEKVRGYRNLDQLTRVIDPHCFRIMKSECLDLPPKIYQRRAVELTAEQARAYAEMKAFASVELANGAYATANLAIGVLTKLHQIVCGHVRTEEGDLVSLPSNRVAAVLDVADELAGPTVIWCAFRPDVETVVAALCQNYPASRVVQYHGGTSAQDRALAIEKIQSGKADFFVATQATGGYGITLTAASNVIYYSNSFNLEQRLQSEDRCHRIGQHRSVSYTDLCAFGTIDERLIAALRAKKDVAHEVMGDGIQEWLK